MQNYEKLLTQEEIKGLKKLTVIHLALMQAMLFYLLIPQLIIDPKIPKEINEDLGMLLQISAFIMNFLVVLYYRSAIKKIKPQQESFLANFSQLHIICWVLFEVCAALGIVYAILQNDPKGSLLFVLLGFASIVAHPSTRARYLSIKQVTQQ